MAALPSPASPAAKFIISGSSSSPPTRILLPFTTLNLMTRAADPRLHFQFGSLRNPAALCARTAVAHSPSVTTAALSSVASANVILGQSPSLAEHIQDEIAAEVSRMKEEIGAVPGLGLIIVGDRMVADRFYCLKRDCESVGINSLEVHLPADSSEGELLKHIQMFNHDLSVHGILVRQPLPSHLNGKKVLDAVCIEKDVQGIHPFNIGCLATGGREPLFVPCTTKGCLELLHRHGIPIKGKRAVVVVDRSDIVGTSLAQLLHREEATVTVVHSGTLNPEEITREADIIIANVGKPNIVMDSWIKPGAVVIDLGWNLVMELIEPLCFRPPRMFGDAIPETRLLLRMFGYAVPETRLLPRMLGDAIYETRLLPRLVGDVCHETSGTIPAPESMRPLTRAMLLSNTLISAKRFHNFT